MLAVGDLHFKPSSRRDAETLWTALSNVLVRFPQINSIVLLGDTLDTHRIVHIEALNIAVWFFEQCCSRLPTFVLVGNHDMISNQQFQSPNHWLQAVRHIPRLRVIERAERIGPVVFAPYVPNGRFREALDTLTDWETASWICAHQEIQGCQLGPLVSETGDPWPLTAPRLVSGHIHEFQHPQPNAWYTGTPLPQNFSDTAPRRVLLIPELGPEPEVIVLDVPSRILIHVTPDEVPALLVSLRDIADRRPDRVRVKVSAQPHECRDFVKSTAYAALRALNVGVSIRPQRVLPAHATLPPGERTLPTLVDLIEDRVRQLQQPMLRELWDRTRLGP